LKNWRLINHRAYDGAMNMAIDEAILEAHLAGVVPPTVRLYGFEPAAVTIGYAQKMPPKTVERITNSGIDVVRRPTGGRAVLHMHELTYSFVGSSQRQNLGEPEASQPVDQAVSESGFLQPSILGAYKQICEGLIVALRRLGVETELGVSDSSYRQIQDCFLATTTADLHYQGKKMAGSAQARRSNAVLQHGSILLQQDQGIMETLLTGGDTTAISPRQRHANLFDVLGRQVSIEDLQRAVKYGFEQVFGCRLIECDLSKDEMARATEYRQKFVVAEAKISKSAV